MVSIVLALFLIENTLAQTGLPDANNPYGAQNVPGQTGITPFDWTSQSYLYSNYGTNPTDMMPWTNEMCDNAEYMDFIVNIPLDSCSPAVIRSDLLEEQNVPVFCRLTGVKVNPLINVPYIKDIQVIQQDKPQEVLGITYYPPNSALGYSNYQYPITGSQSTGKEKVLGVPTMSNLGYVLIMLKQQPNEALMPKNVKINMTLKIFYDVAKTYGLDENSFVLPILTENEWKLRYKEFSFWRGKGYLRLIELKDQTAKIAVYTNPTGNPIDYVTLKEGVQLTQKEILLPGFYCGAGVRLNLEKITLPQNRAVIIVDGNTMVIDEKDQIGDTGCALTTINLEQYGYGGTATIQCQASHADLQITNLEADMTIGDKNYKVTPGQKIPIQKPGTDDTENLENWYVGYIGKEYAIRTTSTNDQVPIGVENIIILFNYTKKTATTQDSNNINTVIKAFAIYLDRLHADGGHLTKSETLLQGIKEMNPSAFGILKDSKNIKIIFQGKDSDFDKLNDNIVKLNSLSGPIQTAYSADTEDKYQSAINYYKEVSLKYPELKREDGATYGVLALKEAIELALEFNKEQDAIDLLNEITKKYGNSEDPEILSDVEKAKQEITNRLQISGQNRQTISTLTGDHSFELIKFLKPGLDDISADLKINGVSGKYTIGDKIGNDNEWEISSITEEAVDFRYIYSSSKTESVSSKSKMILLDPFEQIKTETTSSTQPQPTIPENQIKVEFISTNIKKQAKVNLDFQSERTSVTNFSIGIGIEKRAIQLNPEKTRSLISKLDSTILKIDSINSKIEKLTTVWKKACLAGATALWVKNFADSITGEGYARRKAMEPWIKNCSDDAFRKSLDPVNTISVSRCFQLMESKINSDVEIMEKALKETNAFIGNVKSGNNVLRSSGLFGLTKIINEEEFMKSAQEKFPEELKNKIIIEFKNKQYTENKINTSTFADNLLKYYKLENNVINLLSSSELKDYMLMLYIRKGCAWQNNEGNSMLCTSDKEGELYDKITNLEKTLENKKAEDKIEKGLNMLGINQRTIQTISGEKNIDFQTETFQLTIEQIKSFKINTVEKYQPNKQENYFQKDAAIVQYIWPTENVAKGESTTKKYLLILSPAGSANNKETFTIKEYYELNENSEIMGTSEVQIKPPFGIVTKIDLSKCSRNVMNAQDASTIKFWETGAYAGLVSVMPISRDSGYYFATKGPSILETNTNSWKANGDVQTYYICNVGTDNAISWSADGPIGDDASCCIEISNQVNLNNIDNIPVIPGQENNVNGKSESKRLIELAKGCTKEAIQEFSKGNRRIKTACGTFNLGKPLTAGTGTNCEEFMSPTDCRIMYNLCDPVMCPSSRCDYGGRYPVENVIQSGIIGSLVLCSPNFENGKGVLMPVCLSGLNAGLDALNSVLKSSKDCLNEQLASGKTIGICDQIMSLYLCELMWKELDPFIKSGLPSIVQSTTQKGGGEYALFSESWKTSIDSARFFTNYYGVETFNSFKARSTAEVSTEVCKKFASIAYPTQGQFFSELTKVDSPPQVFASFQEISTGGVSGQSHYKVYYHIYAGKDSGVFYSVYLKNPSSQGYYSVPETYYVKDSYGYLNKGEYKSLTPDFTAPSGYKELCIRINDKDICGFGQATTNFALDEANNLYVESQLGNEVTTAKACVSGTASLIPKVTLNIQQATESMVDPALYKTGIIRICSGTNPGGTDTTRYVNVGYCDNQQIKCWLDTNSVKESISDLGIVDEILDNTIGAEIQKLIDSGIYKTKDQSMKSIQALEDKYFTTAINIHVLIVAHNKGLEDLYKNNNKPSETELKETSARLLTDSEEYKKDLNELEPLLLVERNKAFYPEERARADLLIAQTKTLRAEMTGLLERFIAGRVIAGEITPPEATKPFSLFLYWPNKNFDVYKTYSTTNKAIILRLFTFNFPDQKDIIVVGDGTIVYSDFDIGFSKQVKEGFRYSVIVSHGNGVYSYYGNLVKVFDNRGNEVSSRTAIKSIVGQFFTASQKIGESTGDFYFKTFLGNQPSEDNLQNPLCFFDNSVLVKLTSVNDFVKPIGSTSTEEKFQKIKEYKIKNCNFIPSSGEISGANQMRLCVNLGGEIISECNEANKILQFPINIGDFRDRIDPFNYPDMTGYSSKYYPERYKSIHRGVDIYAKQGADVLSIAAGEIIDDSGTCINIYHKSLDYTSIYCHIKKDSSIKKGNEVKIGQKIGIIDYPSAPHLHLTIYSGKRINSAPYSSSYSLCGCTDTPTCDANKKLGCQTLSDDQYLVNPITLIPNNPDNFCCKKQTTTEKSKSCSDYTDLGEIDCNKASEGTTKCVWVQDLDHNDFRCAKCPPINGCSSDIKLPGGSLFTWWKGLDNDRQFIQAECGSGKISDTICGLKCIWTSEDKCSNLGSGSATITPTATKICPSQQTPVVKDPTNPAQTSCMACPVDCTQTFASDTSGSALSYFSTKEICENAKIECGISCNWNEKANNGKGKCEDIKSEIIASANPTLCVKGQTPEKDSCIACDNGKTPVNDKCTECSGQTCSGKRYGLLGVDPFAVDTPFKSERECEQNICGLECVWNNNNCINTEDYIWDFTNKIVDSDGQYAEYKKYILMDNKIINQPISIEEAMNQISKLDSTQIKNLKVTLVKIKTELITVKNNIPEDFFKEVNAYNQYFLHSETGLNNVLAAIEYKSDPNYSKIISFKNKYYDVIKQYSADSDITITAAVIYHESEGVFNAISPTGCVGLGQLCYCTAWSYSDLSSPSCVNQRYSKTGIEIFQKLTPCNCGTGCNLQNADCTAINDDRFDIDKNIHASTLHFGDFIELFKQYTYKYEFATASYNAGEGVIRAAISSTKKSNPTWNEVFAQLTPALMKRNGYSGDDWTDEILQKKIDNEIKVMVDSVMVHKVKFDQLNNIA